MTIDLLNLTIPFLGMSVGLIVAGYIVKLIVQVMGSDTPGPISSSLEKDLAELRRENAIIARVSPPPAPSKEGVRQCGYCGQVSKGFGPCPHCGAPRI